MSFNKTLYWIFIIGINIVALIFIGIAFLTGPPGGGEGAPRMTPTEHFIRVGAYASIVSAVFSSLIYCISFIFRKVYFLNHAQLRKIFIVQLLSLLIVFLLAWIGVMGVDRH